VKCAKETAASLEQLECACGGLLSPVLPPFDEAAIDVTDRSVWRYRNLLPVDLQGSAPLRLGEGGTPLEVASLVGIDVHFKLEFLQPTGSYKDRGSTVLASALSAADPRGVIEDSSGNAGASMAAYLSRGNIPLQLFVPSGLTPGALRQAEVYGAVVDGTAATRAIAARSARDAVTKTHLYASHVYSPYFMAGVCTLAFELWEDLGREAPQNVVVPVGQGVLLLGLYYGFQALLAAGYIDAMPRLMGVQARACAPIYEAHRRNQDVPQAVTARATRAHGIAVSEPPRGTEVLAALRDTGGAVLTVSDAELDRAQQLLANLGWYVEPTAAAAVAGLVKLDKWIEPGDSVVVPLTGAGLKDS
jgi:threonine synthase